MRVWVIRAPEPIPSDGATTRLFRAGLLAQALRERGHEVVWWNSTVDHYKKRLRSERTVAIDLEPGYRIWLLHGGLYRDNVTFARLRNHWRVAREFHRHVSSEPRPDVIVASMPTIELAYEAVRYGEENDIPVIVDTRDLWPDIWIDAVPAGVRPFVGPVMGLYRTAVARVLRKAFARTACSQGALEWAQQVGGTRARRDTWFPHGVHIASPEPDALPDHTAREKRGRAASQTKRGRTIAFAGSITARTGVADFLKLFAALDESVRGSYRIRIAGAGPLLRACQLLVDELCLHNVEFLGWIGQSELAALFRTADAGLLPYPRSLDFQQSLPNKLCEYLAHGLPVLTSLTGEAGAYLQRTRSGITYHPGDAASLQAALTRLLSDDVAEEMRVHARAAGAEFRAERIYGAFADYLENIVARG